jgi:hypothetical protein
VSSAIVEPCDDEANPYHVCQPCHERLMARALRPSEWYNLAKRHGWSRYLLHDDFYDEDGTAAHPEGEVTDADSHPAPCLSQVSGDPDALLDYSITRWHLDTDTKDAWRAIPASSVLEAISTRFASTGNGEVRGTCLEIAAITQGEDGADFIRYCWGEYPAVDLVSLAQASAACLPFREGFDKVRGILDAFEGAQKRDLMFVLSYFRSTEALDWIERSIFDPISDAWGSLAAASDLDWPRVEAWLGSGRPLSLVAIDALRAIVRPQSPLLQELSPVLRDRPSRATFATVLNDYMRKDPVPRVQQRITGLLEHGDLLAEPR